MVGGIVNDTLQGLDQLVSSQQVGVIDWLTGDVCRYHFVRAVIVQSTGPSVTTRSDNGHTLRETTKQTILETHRAALHTHELVNARKHRLPALEVPKPRGVHELISTIPVWLQPYIRVVAGDQIRESVIERDLRTDTREQTTERVLFSRDPAVVLGRYVLAGWTDRDIEHAMTLPPLSKVAPRIVLSLCLALLVVGAIYFGPAIADGISSLFHFITHPLKWFFQLAIFLGVVVLVIFGIGVSNSS